MNGTPLYNDVIYGRSPSTFTLIALANLVQIAGDLLRFRQKLKVSSLPFTRSNAVLKFRVWKVQRDFKPVKTYLDTCQSILVVSALQLIDTCQLPQTFSLPLTLHFRSYRKFSCSQYSSHVQRWPKASTSMDYPTFLIPESHSINPRCFSKFP